jgi:hypothetical protein
MTPSSTFEDITRGDPCPAKAPGVKAPPLASASLPSGHLERLARRPLKGYNSAEFADARGPFEEAVSMGREQPLDEFRWLSISRPRRLMLGDLMVGVAVAALACFTLTATLRSELSDGDRAAFGMLVLVLFGLQAAQWKLGSIPTGGLESMKGTLLGIASYLVGMMMFVCLFVLACVFAEGAAFVMIALLILVVYLTTWD